MSTHDHICCPPPEDISALFDGEAGRRTGPLREHVRQCPACGALFQEFAGVREQLEPLQRTLDADIAEAVLLRLPRRPAHAAARPARAFPPLGVRALGAAAALGAGLLLGLSLAVGGAGVTAAGMSVFEAEPVGGFCAGLPSCVQPGR